MSGDVWDEVSALEGVAGSPLDKVKVDLTVVLGETTMPIHELLRLGRGAVIALDTTADDDVSLFVSEQVIATGQLQLKGERIEVNVSQTTFRDGSYRPPSDPFKKPKDLLPEPPLEELEDDLQDTVEI